MIFIDNSKQWHIHKCISNSGYSELADFAHKLGMSEADIQRGLVPTLNLKVKQVRKAIELKAQFISRAEFCKVVRYFNEMETRKLKKAG